MPVMAVNTIISGMAVITGWIIWPAIINRTTIVSIGWIIVDHNYPVMRIAVTITK